MIREIRGVWIPNLPHSRVLESPQKIARSMIFLEEHGFNVVFPVMWNQGFTIFRSSRMVREGFPEIAPYFTQNHFDPLETILQEAHRRNIAVIPWFEYGFAASPIADGGHILKKKNHWSALDKQGNLVRHGGLTWMNSLHPEVQEFMLDLMREVLENYSVDGIQGDDRLPAMPCAGGYDLETLRLYQQDRGSTAKPPTHEKDRQWMQWRADRLTLFLRRLYQQVKAIDPQLIVSLSPAVYPFCLNHLLQDLKVWIEQDIVDLIHPQIYRSSFSAYREEVEKIDRSFKGNQKAKFAPGIAFKANGVNLTPADILKCVALNRQKGLQGQVFFFYEGLLAQNQAIATALKAQAGYDRMASLPELLSSQKRSIPLE
jgi:uncharacterized lipoprotein YddW (UPF0748 family)